MELFVALFLAIGLLATIALAVSLHFAWVQMISRRFWDELASQFAGPPSAKGKRSLVYRLQVGDSRWRVYNRGFVWSIVDGHLVIGFGWSFGSSIFVPLARVEVAPSSFVPAATQLSFASSLGRIVLHVNGARWKAQTEHHA